MIREQKIMCRAKIFVFFKTLFFKAERKKIYLKVLKTPQIFISTKKIKQFHYIRGVLHAHNLFLKLFFNLRHTICKTFSIFQ
jgi:hypothetical protein